jgi:carbon starvation protein
MVVSDMPSRKPEPPSTGRRRIDPKQVAVWTAVSLVAAVAWGVVALARGERISAIWLVAAAVGSYAIGYRFYARFIATRVLQVDDTRGLLARSCGFEVAGACRR